MDLANKKPADLTLEDLVEIQHIAKRNDALSEENHKLEEENK